MQYGRKTGINLPVNKPQLLEEIMKTISFGAFALAIALVLAVTACSKPSVRVMPGTDGTNRVVARDVEKPDAEQAAFEAAKTYCEELGKEAVFLSDDVEYTGSMDESQREAIRKASGSATMVAGVIRATEARDAAVVFEGGAAVGRSATAGKDYEAVVRFTCESK
jgi:hypothetical protein